MYVYVRNKYNKYMKRQINTAAIKMCSRERQKQE